MPLNFDEEPPPPTIGKQKTKKDVARERKIKLKGKNLKKSLQSINDEEGYDPVIQRLSKAAYWSSDEPSLSTRLGLDTNAYPLSDATFAQVLQMTGDQAPTHVDITIGDLDMPLPSDRFTLERYRDNATWQTVYTVKIGPYMGQFYISDEECYSAPSFDALARMVEMHIAKILHDVSLQFQGQSAGVKEIVFSADASKYKDALERSIQSLTKNRGTDAV